MSPIHSSYDCQNNFQKKKNADGTMRARARVCMCVCACACVVVALLETSLEESVFLQRLFYMGLESKAITTNKLMTPRSSRI